MRNGKGVLTPAVLRCLVVVTIDLVSTWLVNTYLYPQYNSVLPQARDASSVVGVAVFIALALWAVRKPASINDRTLATVSMVGFAFSFALIVMGIYRMEPLLLLAGSCLRSMSTRWFVVMAGMSLCTLDKRACMLTVAGAFLLSYAVRLPLAALGEVPLMLVIMVLPFVMYALCRSLALQVLQDVRAATPPAEASITQPASYLPFAHNLFIAIFAFRIAYGLALTFGSVEGNPPQTFLAAAPLLVVFAAAFLPRMPKADVLYQAAALFVVAGFLAVIVQTGHGETWLPSAANGLLYAGSECFDALVWLSLASIGARNRTNALAVIAWGRAASSAGLLLGATIGHGVNAADNSLVVALSIAAVLLVFVAVNLTVLKGFGFQATIDGVQSAQPVMAPPPAAVGLSDKCAVVAGEGRLTPRETEILALLAHGRNGPFIQENLVLSRNTVKTHVANIYAKLGVHSQQELIDLVEQVEVRAS
ncbi:MAG: helix-turn-helix transcriptional regulator [Gordonibacter sp.]|uniref:helix-turn-helix transcriptional regulator n=1 Tax=Gordonibacter sp. TaxID=1968902 RepID=UPI002FC61075